MPRKPAEAKPTFRRALQRWVEPWYLAYALLGATAAGLAPILLENSFQAQVLIPMATSLSFGLMVSTALVLMQVPVFYRIYFDLMYPGGVFVMPPDEGGTTTERAEQLVPTS